MTYQRLLRRNGLTGARTSGELEDPEFSESDMEAALARLPEAPALA